ncbi:MAG TPA: hypothetical protein VHL60_09710 [Oxalicibacterium sp.]|jgi:hypothetical protein|nr:hypothetical protein [Oxalicibacterium sp.]
MQSFSSFRTALALLMACAVLTFANDANAGKRHERHGKRHVAPVAPHWEQEPTSFLSLPLGASLPLNRQCPSIRGDDAVTSPQPNPCWQGESNVKRLYQLPSPGFALDSAYAVLDDGRIGTIIVNGERAEYAAMKHYLIDTYGRPTHADMTPMGQNGGMMLGIETLRWEGDTVAIRLEEIYNRVDMFRLVVMYKPASLHTALLSQQDAAAASGFPTSGRERR